MTRLRPARPEDAAAIAAIYAPHVTGGVASFETQPPDSVEIGRRMALADAVCPWLVAEEATIVGYAYASAYSKRAAYRWTVETTIYLADTAHGRGVGRQLYAALLDSLACHGFAQAVAKIALPNPASIALHEKLGFVHVGTLTAVGWKDGRWVDVGLWQRGLALPGRTPADLQTMTREGLAA